MFSFSFSTLPRSRFIYCNSLDMKCHHLYCWTQVKTQLPPEML
jgi:hypothetical protein